MDQLWDQVDSALDEAWSLLIVLLEIFAVVVVCSLLSRWVRRWVRRRVARSAMPESLAVVVENLGAVAVYIVGVSVLLGLWGATWQTLITAFSLSSLALAIGLQDVLKSVVGGLMIAVEQPFVVGDRIKVKDVEGEVEQITLRSTIIRSDIGERIAAPNALIFSDPVTNRSPYQSVRTILLVRGALGEPAALKARAQEALSDTPGLTSKLDISVRTARPRRKLERAIDALPGIEILSDAERAAGSRTARAGMLRITWEGSGDPAVRKEVIRRLKETFPGSAVKIGRW